MNKEVKCFAEADGGKCRLLTVRVCQGHEKCSFFKTEEQANIDREKAIERLKQLPFEQQIAIADKYYENRMPWSGD